MNDSKTNRNISIFQAIFFLSLFILYAIPCIGRFFYQDDFAGMLWVKIGSIGDLWRVIGQPLPRTVFYRPVGNLLYSFDLFLWGTNAFMFFLHSILWQLLSIYLIYKLVRFVTDNAYTAILSEILFLFYFPMNSGSVSLLSNRHSVVVVVFCLLSFYYFYKMRKEKSKRILFYAISFLFFGLAVFTKESAFPFVLIFMVADYLFFKGQKGVWIAYCPYFILLILRYFASPMAQPSLPFGKTASDYTFVFGINIIANLGYYLSWLLLPAVVIIMSLWVLSLINNLKIEWGKAFPREISIFGLSFALINTFIYLPFAAYRQLGYLHMSTIGMAIFLAAPTYYFLNLISSKEKARKSLFFVVIVMTTFFTSMGAIFIPSKLIKRNEQSGYSKRFIQDFSKLHIERSRKVFVVDIGSKDYKLSDTFISPMANRDVLHEAIFFFLGAKTPKEIHLIDNLKKIGKIDADTVVIFYKNGKLFRNQLRGFKKNQSGYHPSH